VTLKNVDILYAIIFVLAQTRFSLMFTADKIFNKMRDRLQNRTLALSLAEPKKFRIRRRVYNFFYKMLHCFDCTAFWTVPLGSIILYVIYLINSLAALLVMVWFAAAWVVAKLSAAFNETYFEEL